MGRAPSERQPVATVWSSIVEDINRYEGYLSEIVIDQEQEPSELLRALINGSKTGEVGIGILAEDFNGRPDTWGSVIQMAKKHPISSETKTTVLFIDGSAVFSVDQACSQLNDANVLEPGPLCPSYWQINEWGTMPLYRRALGGLLAPMMGELRDVCEVTGGRVFVITVDVRPDHGRGAIQKSHYFRDARVRSHIGDAGRYYAHLRYLVESASREDRHGAPGATEPLRATMIKDEGEGLMGRCVWG